MEHQQGTSGDKKGIFRSWISWVLIALIVIGIAFVFLVDRGLNGYQRSKREGAQINKFLATSLANLERPKRNEYTISAWVDSYRQIDIYVSGLRTENDMTLLVNALSYSANYPDKYKKYALKIGFYFDRVGSAEFDETVKKNGGKTVLDKTVLISELR
jgi:hypothetical protein